MALSATVGAVLVGFIGGIFITVRDSSLFSTFDAMVGLEDKWSNIFPKILLFVMITLPDKIILNDNEYQKCLTVKKFYDKLNASEIVIADYNPKEKDILIDLVMNFLNNENDSNLC